VKSDIFRKLARCLLASAIMVGALSAVPMLSAPAHAEGLSNGISRGEVIARAHYWLSVNVPYSQSANYPDPEGRNYRTDCSGFVSMAWHLDQSRTTDTLDDVSTAISASALKPGDILLRRDSSVQHVVIFENWTNTAHTLANFIAEANTADDMNYYQGVPVSTWPGFTPRRYNQIFDDTSDAANEQAPIATTGAQCTISEPADATIDLPNRRDVYIQATTCVKYEAVAGGTGHYTAWVTLHWEPGKDSDDSSDMTQTRFDGFRVHTQIQQNQLTKKEVYCYLDDNINAAYTGTQSCQTSFDVAKGEHWTADGFMNWNLDGDGLYWLNPWYAGGTPYAV
jgi:hypothetical protein